MDIEASFRTLYPQRKGKSVRSEFDCDNVCAQPIEPNGFTCVVVTESQNIWFGMKVVYIQCLDTKPKAMIEIAEHLHRCAALFVP